MSDLTSDLLGEIDFDLADVLAESREWLVNNGWGQGEFRITEDEYGEPDDDGECEIVNWEVVGYCAMGGYLYSQHIEEEHCSSDPGARAVAAALVQAIGLGSHHPTECSDKGECTCVINWVTSWNDDDKRTEQDVLDAFMKAEKEARSGNVDE